MGKYSCAMATELVWCILIVNIDIQIMDSLKTLVSLITSRALTEEESTKMTEAIIQVRELIKFAIDEKERRERHAQNEMMLPPWNR